MSQQEESTSSGTAALLAANGAAGKKKKKAGKAAKTNLPSEDIDALLAELDGAQPEPDEPLQTVSGGL